MNPYTPKEAPAGYKECARYPGLYVNDEGQVFCDRRGQLKLIKHSDGCLVVNYCVPGIPKRQLKVHRLVAEAFLAGFTPSCQIDHIYHNRSDNRVSQLRLVTCRVNHQNLKGKLDGEYSSIYPGVSFCNYSGRWVSSMQYNAQHYFLGRYDTQEEAYQAYLYGIANPEELVQRRAERLAKKKTKR